LREGEITSAALTEHALARIAAIDPQIHAFITVTAERARADAAAADDFFVDGVDLGPMQGIPYALKDLYDTAGIATTCHSKLRVDHVPEADSCVAARLRAQGGVLLGKLATHEFALGGPSFDLPFPPARNPWNVDHVTGGSSSGSGAAVAAGLVRMAMGSDTGGSIRGPAALCGTIGLKPTYGLVSRRGVFPLSPSLDHCGPLAWTVEDAAIALDAIAGFDPHDPASADVATPDFRSGLDRGVEGLVIGVPRHFFAGEPDASPETIAALEKAIAILAGLGARIEEVRLPDYELFSACGRVIMFCEAFAIHEENLRSRPLDFGAATYQRIGNGAFITGADLAQAARLRRELALAVNRELKRCNALLTASALAPAQRFDAAKPRKPSDSPVQSMPFNVTGNPAMSVPTGLSAAGLPLSMQLVGRFFDEANLLRIAAAYEREARDLTRRPALATLAG
jgi:aspartyl-tRNA(Asn)/glutamyl-tRNA(Gln) amidotransferase subunit A